MDDVEMGQIGLPDIQRFFVWNDSKVRDLFDSMYQGYPVGYLLFWETDAELNARQIGINNHQKPPDLLIVDGQQRLTSLYAVMKEVQILRKNDVFENIEIAFKPLEGKFEVADAGIKKSSEWISNISKCFNKDSSQFKIVNQFIKTLKDRKEKEGNRLLEEDQRKCERAFEKLFAIRNFPFTALQLSSKIDEEQVAEIFVRINSKGKQLNQSDFILTLMSVYWEEGRKELEKFCKQAKEPNKDRSSPFNYFIEPEPGLLLRVSIGIGFRRAVLKYAYALLRGKNLETGEQSKQLREKQFKILEKAQIKTLNLQNWHDFLDIIQKAGFRNSSMTTSKITLMYTYLLFIIGKDDYKVPIKELQVVISKWFFMSAITTRYQSASETTLERDLASLRNIQSSHEFKNWMNSTIRAQLTSDFWSLILPTKLETSSSTSPYYSCYIAALNLLDAKALYSKIRVWDALDPSTRARRNKVERHHLFPKGYLKMLGFRSTREINQVANYAYLEWRDNTDISDDSPTDYHKFYVKMFDESSQNNMIFWHALPNNWESMGYLEFLDERRKLMAIVTEKGFKKLEKGEVVHERQDTLEQMIFQGEGLYTEFKSTLRVNLQTQKKDKKMEHAVLKTINGFLNSKEGGTLLIGLDDDGNPINIEKDGFENEDKMNLHLVSLIKDKLGASSMLYIYLSFVDYKNERIFSVKCNPSRVPVFYKHSDGEEFYIRAGASSIRLKPSQMTEYIHQRFE
ncbi:MAG: DUF262 domain-containing protein [Flavobacteriaceae bacterium]|nr:DUF262 domain-containing protein [Flavobacteriaceae bacterium]